MRSTRFLFFATLLGAALTQTRAGAQVRASEAATISQTVDGTVITVEYARPRLRGRNPVFGGEVHWQEVWTPGANWATTFDATKDVRIAGHPVPKGKYSMWLTVTEADEWELLLDPVSHRWHLNRPDTTEGQIRFPVRVARDSLTEVLTWSFPLVRASGTTLSMRWSDRRIDLDVAVTPSYALTMAEERARAYLGTWTFEWVDPQSWDSAGTRTMTVSHRDGSLIGTYTPALWPGAEEFILVPIAETWYIPAWLERGEIYDVDKDIVFEFAIESGKAANYEVRGPDDKVMVKGVRQAPPQAGKKKKKT
jgi:hypothetical protein